jgi:hypothetical protein
MLIEFIHFAGIIIALGTVTVIDILGFFSRRSKKWTQVTIAAHHVTKPLIWFGTAFMVTSWILLFSYSKLAYIKSVLILLLIANGSFLSFYVSPKLDMLSGRNKLFPKKLQHKVMLSAIISFCCWWSLVFITVLMSYG